MNQFVQTMWHTWSSGGIVMAAMAVGVIFSNRRLRGSCGRECACDEEVRRECALAEHAAD